MTTNLPAIFINKRVDIVVAIIVTLDVVSHLWEAKGMTQKPAAG